MYLDGKHYPNARCARCRFRHPAGWTCEWSAKVAKMNRIEGELTAHFPEITQDESGAWVPASRVTLHVETINNLPPGAYTAKIHAWDGEGNYLVRITGKA